MSPNETFAKKIIDILGGKSPMRKTEKFDEVASIAAQSVRWTIGDEVFGVRMDHQDYLIKAYDAGDGKEILARKVVEHGNFVFPCDFASGESRNGMGWGCGVVSWFPFDMTECVLGSPSVLRAFSIVQLCAIQTSRLSNLKRWEVASQWARLLVGFVRYECGATRDIFGQWGKLSFCCETDSNLYVSMKGNIHRFHKGDDLEARLRAFVQNDSEDIPF